MFEIILFLDFKSICRLFCNNELLKLLSDDIYWKHILPIPRPLWINTNLNFMQRLLKFNKVGMCLKCNKVFGRYCLITLCNCSKLTKNSYYPRYCIPNSIIQGFGQLPCYICNKNCLYIIVTAYP